jgi:hypothetical protein
MLSNRLRMTQQSTVFTRSLTYLSFSSVDIVEASTPTTFSTVSLGAEDVNRYIVITGHLFSNVRDSDITSITIGGTAMTNLVKATYVPTGTNNTTISSIWILYYPTGATADIVFNVNNLVTSRGIGVYRLISTTGNCPEVQQTSGALSTKVLTLSPTNNSYLLGTTQVFNGAIPTYTNFTKQYSTDMRSGEYASGGSRDFVTGTPTTISSTSCMSFCAAVLQ